VPSLSEGEIGCQPGEVSVNSATYEDGAFLVEAE